MGISGSKNEAPASLQKFSDQEKVNVEQLFTKLTCKNSKKLLHFENLKAYLCPMFSETLAHGIFSEMLSHSKENQQTVDFGVFASSLAPLVKGSAQEQAEILQRLATNAGRESATAQELFDLISKLTDIFIQSASKTPEFLSWENSLLIKDSGNLAHYLLRDLFYPEQNSKDFHNDSIPHEVFTTNDIEKWLMQTPLMIHIFSFIFQQTFPIIQTYSSGFPRCIFTKKKSQSSLDATTLLALNCHLPQGLRTEWRPLFNSGVDGESFSVLLNCLQQQGPTLLLVRDDEGFMFGMFASQAWEINSNFRGNAESFVFSASPVLKIFPATGYNDHFMYLNLNQQTLPNGMGIGGQMQYFGIWIDGDYGKGSCSPSCTTFNCPQLSSKPEFTVASLEAWAVGPKPKDNEEEEQIRSILDKDVEAKAMLEMLGRGPVSEGLREEDPTAQIPEKKPFKFTPVK